MIPFYILNVDPKGILIYDVHIKGSHYFSRRVRQKLKEFVYILVLFSYRNP